MNGCPEYAGRRPFAVMCLDVANQTSRWIREVRDLLGLQVIWQFFIARRSPSPWGSAAVGSRQLAVTVCTPAGGWIRPLGCFS
jgi:hypothetical protein